MFSPARRWPSVRSAFPARSRPIRIPRLPAIALVAALALTACGGEDPGAAADRDPDPAPAATATQVDDPEPSPEPSPSPTGPFAPLTGLETTAAAAARPPVVAKIENTNAAQPQAGLEDADLVFEELVEGGVTRFFAVFHSTLPGNVGPIRSARLVDAALLPWLDGVLLYSGARDEVQAAISRSGADLVIEGEPGFYRDRSRRAPHNLFVDAAAALDGVDRDDLAPPRWVVPFDAEPPAGERDCDSPAAGCDGASLDVAMSRVYTSGWAYDPADGVYRRSQNGRVQPTASGEPIGAANVVVLGVPVGAGGCCDSAGSRYVATTTTGDGRAIVLRDGRWYEATWRREAVTDPLELLLDGQPMALAPGSTWVHLAPSGNLPALEAESTTD